MSVMITLATLLIIYAATCFFLKEDFKTFVTSNLSIVILISYMVAIFVTYLHEGHPYDLSCFKAWSSMLFNDGLSNFYTSDAFTDYPPGYMYILYFIGGIRSIFTIPYDSYQFTLLIKIPAIVANIITGILIYKLAQQKTNEKGAIILALLYTLNPMVLFNSSLWGQVDSIHTLTLVVAVYLIVENKLFMSMLFFVVSVFIKPQSFMLSPLYMYSFYTYLNENSGGLREYLKNTHRSEIKFSDLTEAGKDFFGSLKRLGSYLVTSIAFGVLLMVPFAQRVGGAFNFKPIIEQYVATLGSYNYATVNAYNIYGFFGLNWENASETTFLGIPLSIFGTLALVVIVILSLYLLKRSKTKSNFFFVSAIIIMCTFMFSIKMHERYSFPALVFVLVAYIYRQDKRLLYLYFGLTAVIFANCFDVFRATLQNSDWSLLSETIRIFSLLVIMAFSYMLYLAFYLAFQVYKKGEKEYIATNVDDVLDDHIAGPSISDIIFGSEDDDNEGKTFFGFKLGRPKSRQNSRVKTFDIKSDKSYLDNDDEPLDFSIAPSSPLENNRDKLLDFEMSNSELIENDNSKSFNFEIDVDGQIKSDEESLKVPDSKKSKLAKWRTIEKSRYSPKMTKKDYILMFSIIIIYSFIALINLGNTKSPQTSWISTDRNEIIIDLGQEHDILRMQWLLGQNHDIAFDVSVSEDMSNWSDKIEVETKSVFAWSDVSIMEKGQYVKINTDSDKLMFMEMAFRDYFDNIIEVPKGDDKIATLFDEQDLVPVEKNLMNSTYFDEIYHARTGYEFVNKLNVYEWTHPPLGKVFISWGISLFGMTPFGWRFPGALFGILMLPLIYMFAKDLFRKRFWAFFATFIFAFDFMHFVQTRIATVDTFVTFFIIAAYYFMYKYWRMSFYDTPLKKTLTPLLLSGICMGLGIASKWTGVYAAAGLAVLFFIVIFRRYSEYRFAKAKGLEDVASQFKKNTLITLLFCVLFFVIIPIIIYLISYIPYYATQSLYYGGTGIKFWVGKPGLANLFPYNEFGNFLAAVVQNQFDIFAYHSDLISEHSYSSTWISWPFMLRPVFYYAYSLSDTMKAGISAFGNPAVWWTGIVAFIYSIYKYVKTGSKTLLFLLIAFLAQYVFWIPITRTTYIYHFFPSVPFIVLLVTYMFRKICNKHRATKYAIIYLIVVFAFFVIYFPVLSGIPIYAPYVKHVLRLLPGWDLISY